MAKLSTEVDMSELEALRAAKQEEEEEQQQEEEEVLEPTDPFRSDILTILEADGITEADLDDARQKFGKIFCFPWSETKVYVFRPLFRKEWNTIKEVATDQEHLSYLIIRQGCLHPRFTSIAELQEDMAGIQDTLSEVIMRASGFIGLEEAMATVREL